jgi:hypothetical protein
MLYSRKYKLDDEIDFELKLIGQQLEEVEEAKFLDLRLDPRMSFNSRVEHIRKTFSERMNILKIDSDKSWHFKTKTQIYKSLVRSLIEDSAPFYDTLCPKLKNYLNATQYKCIKNNT